MQELLGRLIALDPQASQSLRVIACFDELVVGNVNTRALLSAAASLAGCPAGFSQAAPRRCVRVDSRGGLLVGEPQPPDNALRADGQLVWLERDGESHANDAIILERLALALRIRHGRGRAALDNRRDMAVLLDGETPVEQRREAAARLGLRQGNHRVVVAPLFARWGEHPVAPEDVVPTTFGPVHVLVVPAGGTTHAASPSGTGVATGLDDLGRSFRTALVALRLWDESCDTTSEADRYGGLVEMLVDLADDAVLPDVDRLDVVAAHAWGAATLEALVLAGSVREAARLVDVHHSTMQNRLDAIVEALGFDPLAGYGKARLGMAWLAWRLRHSRVLDLPAPSVVAR